MVLGKICLHLPLHHKEGVENLFSLCREDSISRGHAFSFILLSKVRSNSPWFSITQAKQDPRGSDL